MYDVHGVRNGVREARCGSSANAFDNRTGSVRARTTRSGRFYFYRASSSLRYEAPVRRLARREATRARARASSRCTEFSSPAKVRPAGRRSIEERVSNRSADVESRRCLGASSRYAFGTGPFRSHVAREGNDVPSSSERGQSAFDRTCARPIREFSDRRRLRLVIATTAADEPKILLRMCIGALLSFDGVLPPFPSARRIPLFLPTWVSACTPRWLELANETNDISGEIFRKRDRSANCRCSRQRRPIGVAPGRAGGGQPRLKRGHSPWSCQSSVGHGHAHSSCSPSVFPVASASSVIVRGSRGTPRASPPRRSSVSSIRRARGRLWSRSDLDDPARYCLEGSPAINARARRNAYLHSVFLSVVSLFLSLSLFLPAEKCQRCQATLRQALPKRIPRRYGSAVGPYRSLLRKFFSVDRSCSLHTASAVVEGSLSSTWQQEDWIPPVCTEVPWTSATASQPADSPVGL